MVRISRPSSSFEYAFIVGYGLWSSLFLAWFVCEYRRWKRRYLEGVRLNGTPIE
jgi:hypothetical protein